MYWIKLSAIMRKLHKTKMDILNSCKKWNLERKTETFLCSYWSKSVSEIHDFLFLLVRPNQLLITLIGVGDIEMFFAHHWVSKCSRWTRFPGIMYNFISRGFHYDLRALSWPKGDNLTPCFVKYGMRPTSISDCG